MMNNNSKSKKSSPWKRSSTILRDKKIKRNLKKWKNKEKNNKRRLKNKDYNSNIKKKLINAPNYKIN